METHFKNLLISLMDHIPEIASLCFVTMLVDFSNKFRKLSHKPNNKNLNFNGKVLFFLIITGRVDASRNLH